ncbi:hypothetical protein EVU96_25240 [Bacillus infantis]|uniref:hypothetical protein n=1 Tax=Bacillus infantis TaxID=324767 RepID=UPI00101DFBD9|nr:hypothetical protein [Bacillus infantis]RYI24993.1 hypothetical protein EVU96_25240 [Bacillus infantis]
MEHIENKLDDHEKRISQLETSYYSLESKITGVENGQLRLENTILNEFKEAKGLTNKLIDHQFGLDKKKLSGKEKITLALITAGSGFLGTGGLIAVLQLFIR